MMKQLAIGFIASLSFACGGSSTPASSADEAAPMSDVEEPDEVSRPPSDGIIRDADGDGIPDDQAGGCAGKNETQCKITAGCAWSDAGECTEAAQ